MKNNKFSMEKVPISASELRVLNILLENNGMNQETLTDRTKMTIGAISKVISKLDKKGLIYCIRHPINIYKVIPERKREIRLFLTGYDYGKNNDLILDCHYFVFVSKEPACIS